MKKITLLFTLITCLSGNLFSQGADCSSSDPFCTGTTETFPNSTGVTGLGAINCCGSTPNPAWYYMELATGGNTTIQIEQTDLSGSGIDVDFVLFGPYPSLAAACATIPGGSVEDCSYSTAAIEQADITGGVAGEIYVLLLTNYAGVPGTIEFTDLPGGTATTDCSIITPCDITSVTAVPTACNPLNNLYDVSGTINFTDPPTTGTLTVSSSCGGSQTFNAPFTSPLNYTISGLVSNGSGCTITASFSDVACSNTTTYTAPANCLPICSISVSATPGACDPSTNLYSVSGTMVFSDGPITGTLTVTSSCGGSQTFNAPFTSPQNYTISGLNSDGLPCTITAVFSDSSACSATANYTAPVNCIPPCNITAMTGSVTSCDPATSTYTIEGTINFLSPPTTGQLMIFTACGDTLLVNPPFVTPFNYTLSGIPADGATCTVTSVFTSDPTCTNNTVIFAPAPPVITDPNDMCINAPGFTIGVSPTGGTWAGSAGVNAVTGFFNPTTAGVGTQTIIYTTGGTCQLNDTTVFDVNPLPVIVTSADTAICSGNSTVIMVGGAATYVWSPSSTLSSSTAANPTATPSGTTTYNVTGTDANGCQSTGSVTVTVNATPVITTNVIASICIGDSTLLTASGAATYVWSPTSGLADPTSSSTMASPGATTTYTVTGTSAAGCSNTGTVLVNVTDPFANFSGNPTEGTWPLTVDFNNNSNGTIYYWSFGNGSYDTLLVTDPDPTMTYDTVGTYVVMLVSILSGCADTAYLTINVLPISSLIIPNIVTANGDGKNDNFRVESVALSSLNVIIFNRWGQQVGEITSPEGTWNCKSYSNGTYYYILNAEGVDGVLYNDITGHFQIVK